MPWLLATAKLDQAERFDVVGHVGFVAAGAPRPGAAHCQRSRPAVDGRVRWDVGNEPRIQHLGRRPAFIINHFGS
jgi:hypothetical protein